MRDRKQKVFGKYLAALESTNLKAGCVAKTIGIWYPFLPINVQLAHY